MELFPGLTQSMSFFFCKAMDNVVSYHHEFLMPEHLLLSVIDHPEVAHIMRRMKIDQKSMRQELDAWLKQQERIPKEFSHVKPEPSVLFKAMHSSAYLVNLAGGAGVKLNVTHFLTAMLTLPYTEAPFLIDKYIGEQGEKFTRLVGEKFPDEEDPEMKELSKFSPLLANESEGGLSDEELMNEMRAFIESGSSDFDDDDEDGDDGDFWYDDDDDNDEDDGIDNDEYDDPEGWQTGKRHPSDWHKLVTCISDKVDQHNPLIGREKELDRTIQVLCRAEKNNPLHVGEPGVGKTALVFGLAKLINENQVPDRLKGARIYGMDIGQMLAGSQYRGDFEKRIKMVMDGAAKEGNVIIYIDEIHNMIGAGRGSDGGPDASNMLKQYLEAGDIRFIGSTTYEEYNRYMAKSKGIVRRFQQIDIKEPSVDEAIKILEGLQHKYNIYHGVTYRKDALEYAVRASDKYISNRFLPDKAIDLVDEAASRLRMELDSMPVEIDATTRQLTQLQIEEQALMKETDDASKERLEALRQEIAEVQEKLNVQKAGWLNQKNAIDHVQELKGQLDEAKSEEERATRNGDLGRASELRYSVIPGLQQQIQDAEAALEAQKQQDGEGLNEQVTSDEIAEVVSAWTGVPVSKMMQGELDKLKGLEGELHKRVIGQDEAVSAVAAAVRRSRAGLSDPDKPIGSFFFLGPTGVGKTELAKALAECLFDDERALVRIDMSEYMEKFSVQRLIGAPPGYVGYDEGGQLTEAVRRRPYSVILLDEMEKAHPDVFNVLLQVLDDGRLTDGQGRQVSFKNTIIIMTSNVGSKAIAELSGKDEEEMRHQVDAAMAQTFRPEFLNRIDDIVVFHPLGMAQIEKIVDIQLADVRARLAKERMTLAITPAAKQMLAVGGLDPVFGARPLKRLVQREVVDAIAAAIIDGTVREGDQVTVDVDKDGGFTVVCDNTPAATYEVPDAE